MVSAKFIVSKTTNNLLTEAPELVEYLQHYASFITGVFSTGKYNKKIVAEYSHIHARGGGYSHTLPILGLHVTSPKIKLRNYRFF